MLLKAALAAALIVCAGATAAYSQPEIPKEKIPDNIPAEVRQEIERLYSADGAEREKAAVKLGSMGERAVAAIPFLVSMLGDGTEDRRPRPQYQPGVRATRALMKMGERAIGPLAAALESDDRPVRRQAGWALIRMDGPKASAALLKALEASKYNDVRADAVRGLGLRKCKEAVEPLVELLSDENAGLEAPAATALGQIGDPRAVGPLIAALGHKNPQPRRCAASALGDIGDPRAVEPLIAAMGDEHPYVRSSVAGALGQIGDPRAANTLIEALKDNEKDVCGAAVSALAKIDAPRVPETLLKSLEHRYPQVRTRAAAGLATRKERRAVEPLIAALSQDDPDVRRSAVRALGKIGGTRAVETLILALTDKDLTVSVLAAEAMGEMKEPRAADGLAALLHAESAYVRMGAARALARIGAPGVPALIKLLKSNDHQSRSLAASSFRYLTDPAAAETIMDLLKDGNSYIRSNAVEILGRIGGPDIVEPLLALVLEGERPGTRTYALSALKKIDTPRTIKGLIGGLTAESARVRNNAVLALGRMKEPSVAKVLIAALKDPERKVRSNAAVALGKLKVAEAAEPLAAALGDEDAGVRSKASGALGAIGPPAFDAASAALKDEREHVRLGALRAIGWIDDTRGVPLLTAALDDTSERVRIAAVWALRPGKQDAAFKALGSALHDESARVREAAANSLGRSKSVKAVGPLIVLLADPDAQVKIAAIEGLVRIGSPAAEPAAHYLVRALEETHDAVRRGVRVALDKMGYQTEPIDEKKGYYRLVVPEQEKPPAGIAELVKSLSAKNYHVRVAARDVLAAKGEEALQPLVQALHSEDLLLRLWAVETLGRMDAQGARRALEPLLKSTDTLLARAAARHLCRKPDADSMPMWQEVLLSQDFCLRACAAEAMGRSDGKEWVHVLIEHFDDPSGEVRRKLIWALGELRHPAAFRPLFDGYVSYRRRDRFKKLVYASYKEFVKEQSVAVEAISKLPDLPVPTLLLAVKTEEDGTKCSALEILVEMGEPVVDEVIDALNDKWLRSKAPKVLERLKPERAIGPLVKATGGPSVEHSLAFKALVAYGETARPHLEKALVDPTSHPMTRCSAAALLFNLGDESGWGILEEMIETSSPQDFHQTLNRMGLLGKPEFMPLIEKASKREGVGYGIVRAAAFCGGKKAIPLIKKALDHPNKSARMEAQRWLDEFSRQK